MTKSKPKPPTPPHSPQKPTLLTLPPELHALITPHLPYPDALALKHTHPHFYALVSTSVHLKVSWLLERKSRGLEWPLKKCVMRNDAAFCGGREVRGIMERRRAHGECKAGEGGCEVLVGRRCGGVRRMGRGVLGGRGGRWRGGMGMWVVGLVVMSLVANVWFVVNGYFRGW